MREQAGLIACFAFYLHEDVRIKSLSVDGPKTPITGRVLARCDRGDYTEYRVVYWNDGKRYDEWLLDHELERLS